MARTPFKLKSGNSTPFKSMGSSPLKQDIPSVQDKTRTKKAKEITIPEFDAENAWKRDKDKYHRMDKDQYKDRYNYVVKLGLEGGFIPGTSKEEKQEIIDRNLTEYHEGMGRGYFNK